eukprot:g2510.t1
MIAGSCGPVKVPAEHTCNGIGDKRCHNDINAEDGCPHNFALYVVANDFDVDAAVSARERTTYARAQHCMTDERGRPIAAYLEYSPTRFNDLFSAAAGAGAAAGEAEAALHYAKRVLLHELGHVLGFSRTLFAPEEKEIIDGCDANARAQPALATPFCNRTDTPRVVEAKKERDSAENGVWRLTTSLATEAAKAHFGCDTLGGVELEGNGGALTSNPSSFLEARVFRGAVMAPEAAQAASDDASCLSNKKKHNCAWAEEVAAVTASAAGEAERRLKASGMRDKQSMIDLATSVASAVRATCAQQVPAAFVRNYKPPFWNGDGPAEPDDNQDIAKPRRCDAIAAARHAAAAFAATVTRGDDYGNLIEAVIRVVETVFSGKVEAYDLAKLAVDEVVRVACFELFGASKTEGAQATYCDSATPLPYSSLFQFRFSPRDVSGMLRREQVARMSDGVESIADGNAFNPIVAEAEAEAADNAAIAAAKRASLGHADAKGAATEGAPGASAPGESAKPAKKTARSISRKHARLSQWGLKESFDFGHGSAGLTQPLQKLGMFTLRTALDEACVVCQGVIERGQVVKVLPCGHPFHKDCVDGWLTKNEIDAFTATSRPPDCPTCKKSLISFVPALREYRSACGAFHWRALRTALLFVWGMLCAAVITCFATKFDKVEAKNWIFLGVMSWAAAALVLEPLRALCTLLWARWIAPLPSTNLEQEDEQGVAESAADKQRRIKERKALQAEMRKLPYGGDIMVAMKKQDRDAIRKIMTMRNKMQGYDKDAEKKRKAREQHDAQREASAKKALERRKKEKAAMR